MASTKRFETVHRDGLVGGYRVVRDNNTGVLYVVVTEGFGGGITALLDRDGKPMVDEAYVAWMKAQPGASM